MQKKRAAVEQSLIHWCRFLLLRNRGPLMLKALQNPKRRKKRKMLKLILLLDCYLCAKIMVVVMRISFFQWIVKYYDLEYRSFNIKFLQNFLLSYFLRPLEMRKKRVKQNMVLYVLFLNPSIIFCWNVDLLERYH